MTTAVKGVALTDKERQTRGLDALGRGLRDVVDLRMSAAASGRPWLPLYERVESHRLGRPFRADLDDPRLLLRILRHERAVFADIDASQRAWIDEVVQAANRAAHATEVTRAQADRALETMSLLAESLDLALVVDQLTHLLALGAPPPSAPADDAAPAVPADTPAAEAPRAATRVPSEEPTPPGLVHLSARLGDLDVEVFLREAVNYALVHNNVSALAAVTVTHRGTIPIQDLAMTIEIDSPPARGAAPIAPALRIPVGDIAPGTFLDIPPHLLAWRFSPATFIGLDESMSTSVHLTVAVAGGAGAVRDSGTVRLLPADEWWAVSIPECLAAFVRPNDPAIAEILTEATALLEARTGSPSLEGYQSGPERVHRIAEAVYDAVAARRIVYVPPPASFEGTGQRIRSHTEVLRDRRGTCLDLACMFAAAWEQAGLRPVLALVHGHAFAGYLTEEMELPTVALAEPAVIATLADSDVFDAVETTAACAGETTASFDEARARVRRWWREDLALVEHLLDVRAAHRRVHPLPTISVEDGVRVVEVVRESLATPLRRDPTVPTPAPGVALAPARVEAWKRSLLDLSYNNPLLKLRDASSVEIHVPAGGLGTLEDLLASDRRLVLHPSDALAEIHFAQGARTAADVEAASMLQILRDEGVAHVALPLRSYGTRVRSLQRRARTSLEETGTSSLYLTLGTLHWQERGAKEGRAPLFLLPVRLTGGRGSAPFILEIDDTRSFEPNHCLVEKLRVTFGLEIPALTSPADDDYGVDIPRALESVRSSLLREKHVDLHVEETARLAVLQFSTIDMWRDMRANWEAFMRRPVVRHLVESPGVPFDDGIPVPGTPADAEATTTLPIPADGSQIEAVRWAAAGKSFILEGPPGTGKSQTITNLIAHCLAEGRSVLFVAEKQAALDVVRQRMDAVGLGALSLDLHGKSQTPTAVRAQISAALELAASTSSTFETLLARYRSVVESLSAYPAHLHQPGPAGLSAWDARQVVLDLQAAGGAELSVPRTVVAGGVDLEEVYEQARTLAGALSTLGVAPEAVPWSLAGPLAQDAVDTAALVAALDELAPAEQAVPAPARSGTDLAVTPAEFEALATWFDGAHAGVARATGEAARTVDTAFPARADHARQTVQGFREANAARLGPFLPAVLGADLDALLARSREADSKFFGKKRRRLAILAELAPVTVPGASLPPAQLTAALADLVALRAQVDELAGFARALPGIVPPLGWNPLDPAHLDGWAREVWALAHAVRLRSILAERSADAGDTVDALTAAALAGGTPADGTAVRRLGAAWQVVTQLLGSEPADVARWSGGRTRGAATREALPAWRSDASSGAIRLRRFMRVREALDRLARLGLTDLDGQVWSGGIRGSDLEAGVRLGVSRAILDERLATTGLDSFDDADRDRLVRQFIDTGEDVRARAVGELSARIVAARTFDPGARAGVVAELRQQLTRRRGGLSIRRLLETYGTLITQITPCFLMSPASVARFLPADAVDFDVVVFDEASQIRVPESVGAMGRAASVVIVGDSKQMPPSSAFMSSGAAEEEDELTDDGLPVPADLESILSEGVESQLPRLLLSWHYRSTDESLIAFSNHRYYEGRLSTLPTPPRVSGGRSALEWRRVDGRWEGGSRGAARVNRAEAQAVVDEVVALLDADPSRSIGVITFNTQQRELILNLLEDVRQTNAHVERALTQEDEPLFVKNLENVQGDERDIILFTLAFARDAHGRMPLNWGPLTRAGGERRLNVAVTRAKERVIVFGSFDPHDLDLTRSASQGLADLKGYLLAAREGVENASLRRAEAPDLHLDQVESALRDAGLEVRRSVGLSDFTVDLAVRARNDLPWIAVLLDGPVWAGRKSVGDREGSPATLLTGRMGWARVERIWLPSWLRDPKAVVREVVAAARSAADAPPSETAPQPPATPLAPPVATRVATAPVPFEPLAAAIPPAPAATAPTPSTWTWPAAGAAPHQDPPGLGAPWIPAAAREQAPPPAPASPAVPASAPPAGGRSTFRAAPSAARHDQSVLDEDTPLHERLITLDILDVIEAEGPILADRLGRIVANRFGLARVREARKEHILRHAPKERARKAPNGDLVYWPASADPDDTTFFRLNSGLDHREIEAIPYEELRNAMMDVVRRAHAMNSEDALRETAREFGAMKLGPKLRERLDRVLRCAMEEGSLVGRGGLIEQP